MDDRAVRQWPDGVAEHHRNPVEVRPLPLIVPPRDLVEIAVNVLLADPVPDADHGSTDLSVDGLGGVRVRIDTDARRIARDILAGGMGNGQVRVSGHCLAVGW